MSPCCLLLETVKTLTTTVIVCFCVFHYVNRGVLLSYTTFLYIFSWYVFNLSATPPLAAASPSPHPGCQWGPPVLGGTPHHAHELVHDWLPHRLLPRAPACSGEANEPITISKGVIQSGSRHVPKVKVKLSLYFVNEIMVDSELI